MSFRCSLALRFAALLDLSRASRPLFAFCVLENQRGKLQVFRIRHLEITRLAHDELRLQPELLDCAGLVRHRSRTAELERCGENAVSEHLRCLRLPQAFTAFCSHDPAIAVST